MADWPSGSDEPKPRRRRGGAFRQAGADLRPGLTDAAGRRGFAEPEILLRWAEIVGPALAPDCRPVKVVYGRQPALGATLVVENSGPRATEIQHMAPQILERINSFYGYRAIARLRVTQTAPAPAGFAEAQPAFDGPADSPPPAAAQARAAVLADGIQDPGLRAVLTRLGGHVLAQNDRTLRDD